MKIRKNMYCLKHSLHKGENGESFLYLQTINIQSRSGPCEDVDVPATRITCVFRSMCQPEACFRLPFCVVVKNVPF